MGANDCEDLQLVISTLWATALLTPSSRKSKFYLFPHFYIIYPFQLPGWALYYQERSNFRMTLKIIVTKLSYRSILNSESASPWGNICNIMFYTIYHSIRISTIPMIHKAENSLESGN